MFWFKKINSLALSLSSVTLNLICTILHLDCCCCCSCCSCYIFLSPVSIRRYLLEDPHPFHCNKYFVFGRILTCLRVVSNPMVPVGLSELLSTEFAASLKPPTINVNDRKASYPRTQNVSRVRVEPRSCCQVRRKKRRICRFGHVSTGIITSKLE